MKQHIIDAVLQNAAKHEHRHGMPEGGWDQARDLRYLRALTEEVGELAAALAHKHDHPLELELMQIAGICLNWLGARNTSPETMAAMSALDLVKHTSVVYTEEATPCMTT